MLYLALTLWPLGDIGRAVSLVGDAEARIAGLPHIGTRAYGKCHAAMFELMRGDLSRAASNAAELAQTYARARSALVAGARGLFRGLGEGSERRPAAGSRTCVAALELLREQNVLIFDGLVRLRLPKPKPVQATSTAPSRSSTKRWRRPNAPAIAPSKPNSIGCAANAAQARPR